MTCPLIRPRHALNDNISTDFFATRTSKTGTNGEEGDHSVASTISRLTQESGNARRNWRVWSTIAR